MNIGKVDYWSILYNDGLKNKSKFIEKHGFKETKIEQMPVNKMTTFTGNMKNSVAILQQNHAMHVISCKE